MIAARNNAQQSRPATRGGQFNSEQEEGSEVVATNGRAVKEPKTSPEVKEERNQEAPRHDNAPKVAASGASSPNGAGDLERPEEDDDDEDEEDSVRPAPMSENARNNNTNNHNNNNHDDEDEEEEDDEEEDEEESIRGRDIHESDNAIMSNSNGRRAVGVGIFFLENSFY